MAPCLWTRITRWALVVGCLLLFSPPQNKNQLKGQILKSSVIPEVQFIIQQLQQKRKHSIDTIQCFNIYIYTYKYTYIYIYCIYKPHYGTLLINLLIIWSAFCTWCGDKVLSYSKISKGFHLLLHKTTSIDGTMCSFKICTTNKGYVAFGFPCMKYGGCYCSSLIAHRNSHTHSLSLSLQQRKHLSVLQGFTPFLHDTTHCY